MILLNEGRSRVKLYSNPTTQAEQKSHLKIFNDGQISI